MGKLIQKYKATHPTANSLAQRGEKQLASGNKLPPILVPLKLANKQVVYLALKPNTLQCLPQYRVHTVYTVHIYRQFSNILSNNQLVPQSAPSGVCLKKWVINLVCFHSPLKGYTIFINLICMLEDCESGIYNYNVRN